MTDCGLSLVRSKSVPTVQLPDFLPSVANGRQEERKKSINWLHFAPNAFSVLHLLAADVLQLTLGQC